MLTSLTSDSQSLNADNQFSTSKFCDESSDDGDVNNDVADNDREEKEMQKAPNELLLEVLFVHKNSSSLFAFGNF